MAVLRLYPLTGNFADFDAKDKARNAFLTRGFLPSDAAKLVQGERKSKFQRAKVKKMLVYSFLSEAEIQQS